MNSDEMKGKWTQLVGSARKQWGKLTDDDIGQVQGDQEVLIGKIQERYGIAREDAERQVHAWHPTL